MQKIIYRGPNLNRRFNKAAKTIADKIAAIDGVIGIVAVGGIGRGYSDKFSDLDLIVFADESRRKAIGEYIAVGQLHHKGIDFDIPVESYQKARRRRSPSTYWSQARRWTMENSSLLFDTEDRIATLLDEKVIYPDNERSRLMKDNRHWANEILNYMYPTWEARGQVYHLAHILRQAAENIILWIYAKNRKFQPYLRKWLFYHLENDSVPESRYFQIVKRVFTEPISTRREAAQMRDRLIRLCLDLGMEIQVVTWAEVVEANSRNWERASAKTKYYLSW
jgi:hypothetical protein